MSEIALLSQEGSAIGEVEIARGVVLKPQLQQGSSLWNHPGPSGHPS